MFFNPATPYEVPHMILAAYMVVGFAVAGVYAVGLLRGRRDRYHRLGFAVPFAIGAVAAPIQAVFGDFVARAIARQQPQKFAAMELVRHDRNARSPSGSAGSTGTARSTSASASPISTPSWSGTRRTSR